MGKHEKVVNVKKNASNIAVIVAVRDWLDRTSPRLKTPKHTSILSGRQWMNELWHGNENRFFEQFRMRKQAMARLIYILKDRYGFMEFKKVGIDESIGIFLMILSHGLTFPLICERFQHSGQTVHAHFHEMLAAICFMGDEIIKPIDSQVVEASTYLCRDPRYWPHFENCIGAIDGTHINLNISGPDLYRWINRKGVPSTNVLVACDFNLAISYAKVGLEGSMHDARVLKMAIADTKKPFPMAPPGKYYVADAGYANSEGFLTPYKGVRYHLEEYRYQPILRNDKEKFNYAHSSIRSVIERTFGVLKQRWRILKHMTNFELVDQINIIWACFALHNYLRRNEDDDLSMLQEPNLNIDENGSVNGDSNTASTTDCHNDSRTMNNVRDDIRNSICRS